MNFARAAVVAVLGALFLGACATYMGSAPVAELTTARAAITQAEAAGAGQLAPVELLAARGKMVQADAAVRAEQFEQALRLAEQAAADGALAERKARAARARMAAVELERGNAALKQEIGRPAQ
ncbi:MAG: DUF4398 domain-containing protein [Burkholderiales bacterium]